MTTDGTFAPSRRTFVQIYVQYGPDVNHAVGRAARRAAYYGDIEDLRQTVWQRFLENDCQLLSYYDENRGAPMGWFLAMLAYQQALAAIHTDRRQALAADYSERGDPDHVIDPETSRLVAQWIQSDRVTKLMARAANELDDLDRRLLQAVYFEDRRIRDLAREWSLNEHTLYKRHERLKAKLAALLGSLEEPASSMAAAIAVLLLVLAASQHLGEHLP